MKKIVAGFAVSLDGYIEGINGEYEWITIDPSIDFASEMAKYDTFLIGRKSYEKIIAINADFSKWQNYVFSRTLTHVQPPFTLITDNVKVKLNALKKKEGKDIALWEGANLLAALLNFKMVDEITIVVIPILLGKGKPMVDVLEEKVQLELFETKPYLNGSVQLKYKVLNL